MWGKEREESGGEGARGEERGERGGEKRARLLRETGPSSRADYDRGPHCIARDKSCSMSEERLLIAGSAKANAEGGGGTGGTPLLHKDPKMAFRSAIVSWCVLASFASSYTYRCVCVVIPGLCVSIKSYRLCINDRIWMLT